MNVSEIMNVDFKKFSIDKDRLVPDALHLMDKIKTSILLCIDNKVELVGIITERDLLDRLGSKKSGKFKTSSIRISSVMNSNPEIIRPEESVYEVAQIMADKGFTGLPVVDTNLIGFISQNEMIKVCRKVNTITIDQIIDRNPIIMSEDERIIHARRVLFEKNISSIVVGSVNSVIGVVTEGILARAFAKFRENVPWTHQEERIRQITLGDCLKHPIFVSKDITVSEAAKILLNKGMRLLVVLDKTEKLLGIISKDTLIEFIKNKLSLKNYK
ncbi:MAG: CBS domain-containing protein [Candidatus Helarchaeota archaeon]